MPDCSVRLPDPQWVEPYAGSMRRASVGACRPAATNKVEAYNGFSAWLRFGHDAIERNDPAEQEKIIKFNSLLANCVIFHTALDMTAVLRQLAEEDWTIAPAALAALSPYITEPIKRFGEYATDGLTIPPAAFDPRLGLSAPVASEAATTTDQAA